MNKVSNSFKFALNLNSFQVSSILTLLVVFIIRTSTQLTIRIFIYDQNLEILRKFLYFYELSLYKDINQSLTQSIILGTFLLVILLFAIIICRKIQPAEIQNQFLRHNKHILSAFRVIFLLLYIYQYPLLGFSLNLASQSIKLGYYIYLPISIVLSLLIIHFILVIQGLGYTLSFNNKSLLIRNRSYIKSIKAVVNMLILIYFQIKRNQQIYGIQYAIVTIILILVYCIQLRNFFKNATYYYASTRRMYLLTIIVGTVLNFYLFMGTFKISIVQQNFLILFVSTTSFMYISIDRIYRSRQIELVNQQVDKIESASRAIIYIRCAIDIIEQARNKNKSVLILGLLMNHKMQCDKQQCICKQEENLQALQLQKFVLEYFLQKIELLRSKFQDNLTFLITYLNFKLQIAGSYNTYMIEVNRSTEMKSKLGWHENFIIAQSHKIFQQYVIESNSKSNIADTELVFEMAEKKEQILQIMIKICQLSMQRWRMNSISYYPMIYIQQKLDELLEYVKLMEEYKNWFIQQKVKNPEFCTIFVMYYSSVLNISKQRKQFITALQLSQMFLNAIEIVTADNIRQVVFGINCCTIQSPISSRELGIITNCTNSLEVLMIQRQLLIGKNIKIIMPQSLSIYHDKILENWMKTGYKKSMNKVKRVFVVRGTKEKQLAQASLYLKLYYNSSKKILNFITSIVKENNTDYLLLNENLKIQGYGNRIAKITPNSIVGESFSRYSSLAGKYFSEASQKPIKDVISIRINLKKRWKASIIDYKYEGQYSSYQMVGKKFLLIKLNDLLSMEAKKNQTIVRRQVVRRNSGSSLERNSMDSNQTNKNSMQEQFQYLDQAQSSNNVFKNQCEQIQIMSCESYSTSFNYFLDNIFEQCLEKMMNPNKIKLGTKKYIFIFVYLLLALLMIGNAVQSLFYIQYLDSTTKILRSQSHSASIVLLEALYCKQIMNYKIAIAPFITPLNYQSFMKISSSIKNRLFNTLAKDFQKINDKLITGTQLLKYLKKQQPISIGNSLVNSNFLFLSYIYHTVTLGAFQKVQPNNLLNLEHIVRDNWEPLLDMIIEVIPETFNELGKNIRYSSYLLLFLNIICMLLIAASIISMILIENNFQNKKKAVLLTNQIISQKFSQQMIAYYSFIKQSLQINKLKEIESEQISIKSNSNLNMHFQYQKSKSFIFLFIIMFCVWVIPQTVFLSLAVGSVDFIESFNNNVFQAIEAQKKIYLSIVNLRKQLRFNGWDFDYDNLSLLKAFDQKVQVDDIFISLSNQFIATNSFQQEMAFKLNEDVCQLIKPYSSETEVSTCKQQSNIIMLNKGIVISTMNLQKDSNDIIERVSKKSFSLATFSRSQFLLNFMSDYFLFLGIDSLIQQFFKLFQSSLDTKITTSYIISTFGIIMNVIVGIFWWFYSHFIRKSKQSKLFGYTLLFPIQIIRQNKMVFKKLESHLFSQL